MSQKTFAAQSGVSPRSYQGYEDGRSVPGGDAIAAFVKMGVNANWLLTGEGEMLRTNARQTEVSMGIPLHAQALEALQTWQIEHDVKIPADKIARAVVLLAELAGEDEAQLKPLADKVLRLVA
jgi:transcriptional regulator with XRE-family HTH domain